MRLFIICITMLCVSVQSYAVSWGDVVDKIPIGKQDEDKEESLELPAKPTGQASPVEELAREDIRKSETIGNYIGIIAGGGLTIKACKKYARACDHPTVKGLVATAMVKLGSEIGTYIGGAIGQVAADRRLAYATEQDYLDSEIAASEKAVSVREEGITKANSEIATAEKRIIELKEKESLTRKEIKEAKKIRKDFDKKIETNSFLLAQYSEKIAYLDHALETSEAKAKETKEDTVAWQNKYDSLKEKRDGLQQQHDVVESQNIQLSSNQKILEEIIT